MDWRKVLLYAALILAAQILVGFLNGLLFVVRTETQAIASLLGGALTSLLLCLAIFAHLALGQRKLVWEHALFVLASYLTLELALNLATSHSYPPIHPLEFTLWLLEVFVAFLLGTVVGQRVAMRRQHTN
jgi:hypothetical protein